MCVYRFQKRYMLLGGIWFSKSKPPMNMFLRPLLKDINKLQSTGTDNFYVTIINVRAVH